MKVARLETRMVIDGDSFGSWNMASDEFMLRVADQYRLATLRFYGWEKPTLSLGYFQTAADRKEHQSSISCPIVRRHSGGGAILHDQEITYSLALPATSPFWGNPSGLYSRLHRAIAQVLRQFGVPPLKLLEESAERLRERPPFLCFQRRCLGDVVLDNHKIVGSAQRRRRSAILQHGSILLSTSAFASELPGIKDICGVTLCTRQTIEAISTQFAKAVDLSLSSYSFNSDEVSEVGLLAHSRFESDSWTSRR